MGASPWYFSGLTKKIAISLPDALVDQAQRAVARGLAESVSAYVATSMEEKAKLDDLGALLEAMLAETGGPLTASERRAVAKARGRPRKSAKKKGRAA